MSDLSVIIVTFNPGDLILACLKSVEAASAGLDTEIIVIDNASEDGTTDQIKTQFKRVRLVANPDNRGFAAACNQGMAIASGQYLLLLNPDTVVEPDALTSMTRFMDAHPHVGIVGPRAHGHAGEITLTAYPEYGPGMILWQYFGLDRLFPYAVFGRYRRLCEQATEPFRVEWVQGSCLMLRRQVFEAIGGLDESFFLFCEEPDFCQRARAHGWEVHYLPGARIAHTVSSSVSRYTFARVRNYHISPLIYFRKRGRPVTALVLKLGFTLELLAKLVMRAAQIAIGKRALAMHVSIYARVIRELWAF